MKIESVSPSTEMLRACFEKELNFSVHYKSGVKVVVDGGNEWGWELTRFKDMKSVSSFRFKCYEGIIEGADLLTVAMMQALWRENGSSSSSELRYFAMFLEKVLRLYGGKISNISEVYIDEKPL